MHRQVPVRGIQGRALSVLGVEPREVQEQVAVHVRRGQKDLAEFHLALHLRVRRDPLQRAQQAAIAHAVGDHMHLLRAAVLCEVHQEIGNGLLARLDGRLVRRVSRHTTTRWPAKERRRARHLQVEADLGRANSRVLERHVETMQEEQRVRRLAALAGGLHRRVDF